MGIRVLERQRNETDTDTIVNSGQRME